MAKTLLDPLAASRLFGALSPKERKRIAAAMTTRELAAGEHLVDQGTSGVCFFVLTEGEAEVLIDGETVRELGPGDFAGELAIIDGGVRSASVIARTDVTVLALTPWSFKAMVTGNGGIGWALLVELAGRVRAAEARAAEV